MHIMSVEVCGVPLSEFSDPIRVSLAEYAEKTGGRYRFDLDGAVQLDFVPGKLTARSQTAVMCGERKAADLFVIAFAPEDGTGDDKSYRLDQVHLGGFPEDPRYIPRTKDGANSEAHLTIAAKEIETSKDPVKFAGHLRVLGLLSGNWVYEAGYVGQDLHTFASSMEKGIDLCPTVTLTTGHEHGLDTPENPGKRFGDPHAILNRVENAVQVAGFIAITPDAAPKHLELLRLLGAKQFKSYPRG